MTLNVNVNDVRKRALDHDLPGWKAYVELGGSRFGARLNSVFYDHEDRSRGAEDVTCMLCDWDEKYRVVDTDQRMRYWHGPKKGWGRIKGYPTPQTAIIAWRLKNGR